MTKLSFSIFLLLLFCSALGFSQEVESPLWSNPQATKRFVKEREFEPKEKRGDDNLQLPFVDDFSVYSLPTNNPDIPVEFQKWTNNHAYINNDFPIDPPTIGVATLDGLNEDGYPYNFLNEFAYGPADTLTSCPIDLSGYEASDNVYLTFYYQPKGLGNAPNPQDSLMLEFLRPDGSGGGPWYTVWTVPGPEDNSSAEFQRVTIHIQDALYLKEDFQFRFRNYATISGAVDQWHIDYVILDANVDPEVENIVDVAFVYDEFSLLRDYSSMPWTHFIEDPAEYMANSREVFMNNLETQDNNVSYGFQVGYQGDFTDFPNPNVITNFPASSSLSQDVEIKDEPSEFVFDSSVNDTCAYFDVEFYLNESNDANRNNDTMRFVQDFTNYYAYDDGTAEGAYGVTALGGKVAMQFETQIPDTLLGLFIHFIPFRLDQSNETFLLRVWDDNNGLPGDTLNENFQFQSPEYYENGNNVFAFFEYDHPVPVEGTFYVGWVQQVAESLNIGNDKNTSWNSELLFFSLGVGSNWQQSSASGTIMMRPVFKSGKSEVWNSVEEESEVDISLYPNPASDRLHVDFEIAGDYSLSIVDLTGKQWVQRPKLSGSEVIDLSALPAGVYIVRLVDLGSNSVFFRKVIKQ